MRLILLRHGETLWNAQQRLQGQDNSELSERGIEQARRFRAYARALSPAHVISSDLGRTRQTVALIGHPNAPSDARLRELDMGEWTGRTKAELLEQRPEDYKAWRAGTYTPDRGEAWWVFRKRISDGVRHWLAKAEGDLLAVVHGGVIRAACHEFLDLPPSRVIPVTPGTATILYFSSPDAATAQLEGYNIGSVAPDVSVAD
ncbi:phosphoglycerate kinase [Rhizobium sp. Root1203]|uniref:histidine phosphatase family protein n=1 Tax=Rhizobium sp. Root1203 TaxID=1736427 RepID=UPI0007110A4A|nr:histidine phosphatase family protein [Rhizobium sp. Root1203]KQV10783.1 phosphoglycerate kinase [Rhizobium sp. Root1203]